MIPNHILKAEALKHCRFHMEKGSASSRKWRPGSPRPWGSTMAALYCAVGAEVIPTVIESGSQRWKPSHLPRKTAEFQLSRNILPNGLEYMPTLTVSPRRLPVIASV